jgi:hypothetical protein
MKGFSRNSVLILGGLLAATVASSTPAAAPAPVVGAAPAAHVVYRERQITIPAGTILRLRVQNGFGSDTSRVEDPVRATLVTTIRRNGDDVLPAGSAVHGFVTSATRSGKVKGRARVGVRFTSITPEGDRERYPMTTRPWVAVAPATKKKDAVKIAVPAAGGAAIGALVAGKKGAGIGALVGGGGGTAVVLSTRGKEIRVGRGATLAVRLNEPLTVRVQS